MIARRLFVAAKQLPNFSATRLPQEAAHSGFALSLIKAPSNGIATFTSGPSQKLLCAAVKEIDGIQAEKLIDYNKRSSFRAKKAQHAAEEKEKKKKKKRGPPGPVQFEGLTARTPVCSDLTFAFRYSYTEIPKVQPVGFQDKFSPFGPGRLDRTWDGQQAVPSSSSSPPLPPPVPSSSTNPDTHVENIKASKYSFKGVKLVNPPNPSLIHASSRRSWSREEILGDPLTVDEIKEFVETTSKSKTRRQMNMGRDGLTHNMLIEAQEYWKREPIIRVRCKGVPTVDMENVCFQLEEKTGGKIIHRKGGTVYLFRGRNYSYKDRPVIPPMLWKPHAPLYPKLITEAPGGLRVHEANFLRKRGLKIMRLCILSKNGYYGDLVRHVKEAFDDDELVRIDCKGLNTSDYKKIGAKLRDLIPCYLLSFEKEQIILWKGRDNGTSFSDTRKFSKGDKTEGANIRSVKNPNEAIALVNGQCECASSTTGSCNDVCEDSKGLESVACMGETWRRH